MLHLLRAIGIRGLLLVRDATSIKVAKVTSTQNLSIDLCQQSQTYFFISRMQQMEKDRPFVDTSTLYCIPYPYATFI